MADKGGFDFTTEDALRAATKRLDAARKAVLQFPLGKVIKRALISIPVLVALTGLVLLLAYVGRPRLDVLCGVAVATPTTRSLGQSVIAGSRIVIGGAALTIASIAQEPSIQSGERFDVDFNPRAWITQNLANLTVEELRPATEAGDFDDVPGPEGLKRKIAAALAWRRLVYGNEDGLLVNGRPPCDAGGITHGETQDTQTKATAPSQAQVPSKFDELLNQLTKVPQHRE